VNGIFGLCEAFGKRILGESCTFFACRRLAVSVADAGLIGRRRELLRFADVLDAIRGGQSQALILRGAAGIGKTALLGELARSAGDCAILRVAGVQAERELAYAGLHQLMTPILGGLDELPEPQRDALSTAFGISHGSPPDPFFVALAVLTMLAAASDQRPLVCLVDDEQWLDRASARALSFVSRRLNAEPIAIVFASREVSTDLADVTELVIEGLANADAEALLDSAVRGRLDPQIRAQIIHEADGNPLALLELPRGVDPSDLAGGFGLPAAMALQGRIEDTLAQRIEALPERSRRVLQLAAADPVGDPALIWRAAGLLNIGVDAVRIATESGLIAFGARVQFRHPIVRSAAYQSATHTERQTIHDALARATDQEVDPDRHAWHRAQATSMPDEAVAAELEHSAQRASSRGGFAAAAAFLENAAVLTPHSHERARRFIAAARAKRDAGAWDTTLSLLEAAEASSRDEEQAAAITRLRGQIALDQLRASDAVGLLHAAAIQYEPLDVRMARETHLDALDAAILMGSRDGPNGLVELATSALKAPAASGELRLVDLLLDAVATRTVGSFHDAAPKFTAALDLILSFDPDVHTNQDWVWLLQSNLSALIPAEVWDVDAWHAVASRHVESAREAGALFFLQAGLQDLGWAHIHRGDLAEAQLLVGEDELISQATGNPALPFVPIGLAAWRGDEATAIASIDAISSALHTADTSVVDVFCWSLQALLYNGLGQHERALAPARRVFDGDHIGYGALVVHELAEAAARSGDAESLDDALNWMTARAAACPTDWALGIEARIRAMTSDEPDDWHQRSIMHLSRAGVRPQTGRAHLLYGEWLRRQGRRVDARQQLRTAVDLLESIGAAGYAERARRELVATGVKLRKRSVDSPAGVLTNQELHVALLARDGLSNAEIGMRLFISPRTAQYHLGKVFTKLDIRTRGELAHVL
jgi:DNA-binding CsgD family transcriptional regulator